jgi:hypothetical protein
MKSAPTFIYVAVFMRHMKPRDAKPMALVDRFWRLPAKDR